MNDNNRKNPRIICVMGPTGSGKNELVLRLSQEFPLEIINFDSRQVYADLPIITAQPSESDKQTCPHHLYGFLGLNDKISAGRFVEKAGQTIAQVSGKGRIPFLVGGTGLYLRSLIFGLAHIPPVPEETQSGLERECLESGIQSLFQRLLSIDPDYARTITERDRQKIIRALGVHITTGKPFSIWHKEQSKHPYYHALKLGIMRETQELTPFLEQRITQMITAGAVEEMEKAWEKSGRNRDCPAFSGIGCREVISFIEGETDLDKARALWLKNTRAYAKRQVTWFRKEPDISWIEPGDLQKGRSLVNDFWSDYPGRHEL